jgi:DNA-binding PadR family transcriptional regulator
MERKGWVEAEWGVSENNRRAKFYRLTSHGRQALSQESTAWDRYVAAVTKVMGSEPETA